MAFRASGGHHVHAEELLAAAAVTAPDEQGGSAPCLNGLCNAVAAIAQSRGVSTTEQRAAAATSEFAAVYRENVERLTSYFARRVTEPQMVADLVSETFVEAVGSFALFDSAKGPVRAWLYGIARRVFARWYAEELGGRLTTKRLSGRIVLDADETDELARRIDAQAEGRALLARCARLPELERSAIELVDLAGLTPTEAARALEVPAGTLRVRLHRARARLRNEGAQR